MSDDKVVSETEGDENSSVNEEVESKSDGDNDKSDQVESSEILDIDDTKSDYNSVIGDIQVELKIVLGRAKMTIGELKKMKKGAIIELDRTPGDLLDLVVNGTVVAKGKLEKNKDDKLILVLEEVDS